MWHYLAPRNRSSNEKKVIFFHVFNTSIHMWHILNDFLVSVLPFYPEILIHHLRAHPASLSDWIMMNTYWCFCDEIRVGRFPPEITSSTSAISEPIFGLTVAVAVAKTCHKSGLAEVYRVFWWKSAAAAAAATATATAAAAAAVAIKAVKGK